MIVIIMFGTMKLNNQPSFVQSQSIFSARKLEIAPKTPTPIAMYRKTICFETKYKTRKPTVITRTVFVGLIDLDSADIKTMNK